MAAQNAARISADAKLALSGFGSRLTLARTAAQMSTRDLADAAGCYGPDIVQWEKSKRFPSFATVVRLAEALEISIDWLMMGRRDAPRTPREIDGVREVHVSRPCPRCGPVSPLGTPVEWPR